MTVLKSTSTLEGRNLVRNAWWTSLIICAASAVYASYLFVQAAQTGSSEIFRAAIIMTGLVVASIASAWLTRRGRSTLGMIMLISWFFVVLLESTTRWAGLGFLLGLTSILGTTLVALQTLPRPWATRMISASVVVGATVVLLDLFGSSGRTTASFFGAPLVAMLGMLIAAGVVIARRFSTYALRTKLVVSFLLVSVLSVAAVAVVAIGLSQEALTRSANQSLQTAAAKTADAIDSFISAEKDTLRTEALLPDLTDLLSLPVNQQSGTPVAEEVEEILHRLTLREPLYIKSYALLDSSGRTIYSTSDENPGESQFRQVVATGLPNASDIEFDQETDEPSFYIAAPVRNANREVIGVLRVRYDATILQEIVRSTNGLAGPESFATLLDDQNIRLGSGQDTESLYKTVAPLDPARLAELQLSRRLPDLPPDQLATNYPDFEARLKNYQTALPFFAAEIHAEAHADATVQHIEQVAVALLENKAWQVAFSQPQDIFLQPIQAQTQVITIVSFIVAALAALAALVLAQAIANPIVRLTAVANRVKEGDLTAQAPVETRDEIGTLATTFNGMTTQLRSIVGTLEERIQARTEQLRASADVGRTAASMLEPEALLRSVVNLITDRFGFYYAAVFIIDDSGHNAVLREATGEAGRVLKERGHQLEVNGQSMVGYAITRRRARIALDVGEEAVRFANPLLPDTRSEIALPLIVGNQVLGALDVQAKEEAAFDEASAAVLQSMADQIAIAWNNALSYAETEAVARRSRALFAASREVGHLQSDLAETIRATMHAAAETLDYDHWCVLTYNEIRTALVSIAAHNWPATAEALHVQTHPDHPLVTCIQRDTELFITDADDARLHALLIDSLHGLIGVPIKTRDTIVGVLAFSRTHGRELAQGDLEVGRSLANLIAVAIENYNLVETSQRTLRELDEINRNLTGQSWDKFVRRQDKREIIWVSQSDQMQPQQLPEVREALTQGHIATRTLEDAQQLGVAVPIKLRDVPVGALRLIVPRRTWNLEMAVALDSIAGHVAQAAENARLIAETEDRLVRERALADATEKVRQRNEVETILQTAATELARYLNASHIAVRMTAAGAGNGEGDDYDRA